MAIETDKLSVEKTGSGITFMKCHRLFPLQGKQIKSNVNNEDGYNAEGKTTNNSRFYKKFFSDDEMNEGIEKGTLIKGILRVNQRNYMQCFIDNPNGEEHSDLLILGMKDRNRAFHGDSVVVQLKPKRLWFLHDTYCNRYNIRSTGSDFATEMKNKYKLVNYHCVADFDNDCSNIPEEIFKKTCKVVGILEKSASRRMVGHIKTMQNNAHYFIFAPTDSRISRMLIPSNKAPTGFYERPQDFANFIYLAEVDEWSEESKMPKGKLMDNLGMAGDVETEHKALIRINAVDERDYDEFPEVLKSLPLPKNPGEWQIDMKEFTCRRDFHNEVVFTIDPLTARDLDDALHIKRIMHNNSECWEVGVHIADVSYFLEQGTELDNWARRRGTSIYLVHKVIPMLPRILCEELCSLNPGVSRLTFSVVWIMDDDTNIIQKWFGRSIIKSCAKLSYEHAQDIIDHPNKQFAISEMPPIHCARKIRDIKTAVKYLNTVAKKLRAKRFSGGALKLDLPKLRFDVEKTSSGIWQPRGIRLDERKDANFLVEEFMLLANIEVAEHLYNVFNNRTMLRRHPPPKKKELNTLVDRCAKLGININSMSSKSLAESMKHYEHKEEFHYTLLPALNQMLMKCMHLAKYFCTGTVNGPAEFRHYALSVEFYTHFTSPIRRYPDVIVHRMLAASLQYCDDPGYTIQDLEAIAIRANETKACAKLCSETSGDIFFGALVRESGNFEAIGVVLSIFDECFDFLLIKYAIVKRVYLKKQKFVKKIHYGRMEENGPVALVLLLDDGYQTESGQKKACNNAECGEADGQDVIHEIEDENEQDVEINEFQAPAWAKQCAADQRQTLNILSVVRVQLMPLKNSVKYNAYLVPTPDSNPLTWMDAKEHIKDLKFRQTKTK